MFLLLARYHYWSDNIRNGCELFSVSPGGRIFRLVNYCDSPSNIGCNVVPDS